MCRTGGTTVIKGPADSYKNKKDAVLEFTFGYQIKTGHFIDYCSWIYVLWTFISIFQKCYQLVSLSSEDCK